MSFSRLAIILVITVAALPLYRIQAQTMPLVAPVTPPAIAWDILALILAGVGTYIYTSTEAANPQTWTLVENAYDPGAEPLLPEGAIEGELAASLEMNGSGEPVGEDLLAAAVTTTILAGYLGIASGCESSPCAADNIDLRNAAITPQSYYPVGDFSLGSYEFSTQDLYINPAAQKAILMLGFQSQSYPWELGTFFDPSVMEEYNWIDNSSVFQEYRNAGMDTLTSSVNVTGDDIGITSFNDYGIAFVYMPAQRYFEPSHTLAGGPVSYQFITEEWATGSVTQTINGQPQTTYYSYPAVFTSLTLVKTQVYHHLESKGVNCPGAQSSLVNYSLVKTTFNKSKDAAIMSGGNVIGYESTMAISSQTLMTLGLATTEYLYDSPNGDGTFFTIQREWYGAYTNTASFGYQMLYMQQLARWTNAQSMATCYGVFMPDFDISITAGNTYPWDEAGAPSAGTSTTKTGDDVLWVTRPLEALQVAFIPQTSVTARVEDMYAFISTRFPLSLAGSLAVPGDLGLQAIPTPTLDMGKGLVIQADTTIINQIAAVIRVGAFLAAWCLIILFIRGKFTPRNTV